ncbi:unnamed protein product [Darwinula stevensoni]|uniref:PDZ domain-containing protein n=1 Tax=Darwinula stevensoni TaxID=69355 RepID=A0A7R8X2P0_9CRUS|nr:unnamed protein product [Darwinula stevensoni]CAG0884142.1 unnamed protein product [Darwinula stevensoni]
MSRHSQMSFWHHGDLVDVDGVERLLDILPNRGCQAFQTLCLALETTYPHLVTVMFLGTNQQRPPRPLSGPPIQMRNLDFESDPGSDRDSDRGMHGHVISPHDYDLQQSNLALLRAELRLVTHDRDALRKQLQKLMARQGMSSEKIVNGGYFGPLDNRDGEIMSQLVSSFEYEWEVGPKARGTLSRSSGGSLFSNSGSEHSLQEDYESLKHQCERAKVELQTLRRQHSRCESMSKDCEYLRKQGQEAMSKLEAANSNVHALRAQVNDLVANRDRLEQEVASLQKSREEDQKEAVELRRQHQAAMKENGSAETINQLYLQALRKYEALKDDHDSLRKRHTDVISQYSAAASKLELSQEEVARLKLQYEESIQERNAAVRERNQFNKQCTAAIRQWDNALRENSELKEQISKMQQQHDEAMKELNQVLNSRLKHLAEERNSIKQEYRLVMGERDNVHKEIERLQDELSKATMTKKMLEGSNKEYSEELESLKREITVALHDRDRALKEINDLRQRLGGKADGLGPGDREPRHSFEASKENRDVSGHYDGADSLDSQRVEKLENLDQANQEVEKLRKLVEKLKAELKDALQEAEVSKRRRNWAFGERDKIVLERESIRTLCDKLRRERDRAVSDLAEALRDSDDMKKQRNAFSKEIKELRELLEAQEQEMRLQQRNTSSSLTNTFSRDSAIDSDMAEWESTTLHFSHMELGVHNLGVEISLEGARGGNNLPIVTAVAPSSPLYGKLLVSDKLVRINDHDCMGMVPANALNLLQKAPENLQVLVQRRRMPRGVHLVQLVLKGGIMGLGISWENGIYICRISSGSPAAREGTLSIGDRLIMVNQKSVEGMTVGEVEKHLASWKESTVTLSVAKFSPHAARSVFSSLPSSPLDTTQEEKLDAASISTGGGEIGSQELDSGDSSRELHGIGITNGLGLGTRRDVATSPLRQFLSYKSEAEKESSSRGSSSREALTHGKGNRGVMRRLINSSSQTNSSNQPEEVKHRSNERVYTVKKAGGEKGSNSGIRDILKERFIPEFVRVRRQSKERRGPSESSPSSSGKKSFRNSTPSPFEREKEDAIAELDSVIANYQPKGSGTAKRIRRRPVEHVEIEPHGTWPKYRGAPSSAYDSVLYTGTIFPRTQGRKDRSRAPLSSVFPCTVVTSSASAPPYQCAPMHHYDYAPSPFMSSLEQKSPGSGRDLEHNHERISALTPSDTSLDYSVRSASCKKEILEYYVKKKGSSSSKGGGQCQSDSESNLSPVESTTNLGGSGGSGSGSTYGYSTPTHHLRVHSQLYPGPTYMSYPVPMPMPIPHPHPHPHSASARYRAVSPTASLPMTMSRSGDSILSSATHERSFHDVGPYVSSPHAPMYHPGIQAGDLGCPYRPGPGGAPRPLSMHPTHLLYQDDYGHQVYHAEFPQAGTFPRKKDNQRIRIPSNQSVTSKSSAGKLTGSIEQGISDRGSSPMPTFHVETLGKPSSSYWRCKKPSPGELRSVYIEKSSEPLGISISCLNNKGVFVASVAEKSLAERVGLQVCMIS